MDSPQKITEMRDTWLDLLDSQKYLGTVAQKYPQSVTIMEKDNDIEQSHFEGKDCFEGSFFTMDRWLFEFLRSTLPGTASHPGLW